MRVMIATPAYSKTVGVEYLESLIATIDLGKENGIEFIPRFICGDSIIETARNKLVKIARDLDVDSTIWIDADMEWKAEWAVRFAKSDHDVLGAPCVKKSMVEQYNVAFEGNDFVIEEDGNLKVIGVGTGFLKMSRKAINYLWDVSDKYTFMSDEEMSRAFELEIINGKLHGEDIYACKKLIAGGFDINVDTTFTLNHIGTHKFSGNFVGYLEQIKRNQDKASFELAQQLGLI